MCAITAFSAVPEPAALAQYGREALDAIRRDFSMPNSRLLGEERTPDAGPRNPSFNWGVGVMLSALNAAAKFDPVHKEWLREYANAVDVYWNPEGPVAGFDVWPTPKPKDRYYDDNAWMVMSLVEAYENLGDRKHLDRAQETLKYVYSGEDAKLGGGIYWRESDRASKNTCSNGPSASASLAVYAHTKEPARLDEAKRIYAWTKKNLQDPEDGLYWDAMNLDGSIGKMKWSYNTALMIRAAKGLLAATGDAAYKADIDRMEAASLAKWTPDGGAKGAACEGKFVHLLFDAWAVEPKFEAGLRARDTALGWVYANVRDREGRYGHRWERATQERYGKFSLIDQASAARAFFEAARIR